MNIEKPDSYEDSTLAVSDGEGQQSAVGAHRKPLPSLDKAPDAIPKAVLELIHEEAAKKYKMAVFDRADGLIKVALVNPSDTESLNILRFLSQKEGARIEMYVVTDEVFQNILAQYSGAEKVLNDAILSFQDGEGEAGEDLADKKVGKSVVSREILQDAPITKLTQVILRHAVDGRASDIHIEPLDQGYRVRFRVDGVLHASLALPGEVGRAVVSHIKILSNLKIDEKRKPQDGRFQFTENGKVIDLRVSTFPVVEGEKVVMRILDKSKGLADLNSLGLTGRNYEVLVKKIKEPYGIILITGPTGSGKSTTLYAFLQILNQEERNIVTLEDPVEYFLEGINQSQVKPEIGYTFAQGLRSILRQDPNVIMVGEIRDMETAELAIHAALTGHLVFSTLHTNTAIGAVPRLVDMGIEPFLLASALQVVAAQRLVRRICPDCKEEMVISPKVLDGVRSVISSLDPLETAKYGVDIKNPLKLFRGKGCKECNNTGYKGRLAIHEVLEITDKVQSIITEKRGSEHEVKEEALRQGMLSMLQDGLLKALAGMTTLAEVERVTEGNIMVDEE